ncbi:MAG: hypothetical protein ACP5EN_15015 [Rhodovulum sp.]
MAVTIKQTEAAPASWPVVLDLSTAAAALDSGALWQRIEAYTAHRWTARDVVWIVEGPGEWEPPLTPATVSSVEIWDGAAWIAATPDASWCGYDLTLEGPYRITASVGGGDVPAAVSEAFRRLAEYLAGSIAPAGVTSYSMDLGQIKESMEISAAATARAMQNSGAADLLRPYRRA